MPNRFSPTPQYAIYKPESLQEKAYMPALLQQRDQEFIKSAQDQVFDVNYLDWAASPVEENLSKFKQRRDQITDKAIIDGWNPQLQQEFSNLNKDWYEYSKSKKGEGARAESDYAKRQAYLETIKGDNTALQRFAEDDEFSEYDPSMIGKYHPKLRRGEYTFAAPVKDPKVLEEVNKIFSGLTAEEQKQFRELVPDIEQLGNQEFARFQIDEITTRSNSSKVTGAIQAARALLSSSESQDWGHYSGDSDVNTTSYETEKRDANNNIVTDPNTGDPIMETKEKKSSVWTNYIDGLTNKNLVNQQETKPNIDRVGITEKNKTGSNSTKGKEEDVYISNYVRMMSDKTTSVTAAEVGYIFPVSTDITGAVVVNSDLIITNFAQASNIETALKFQANQEAFVKYREVLDTPTDTTEIRQLWLDSSDKGYENIMMSHNNRGRINETTGKIEELSSIEVFGQEIKNQKIKEFEEEATKKGFNLAKDYKEFLANPDKIENEGQLQEVLSDIGPMDFVPSTSPNNKQNVDDRAFVSGFYVATQEQLDRSFAKKGLESDKGMTLYPSSLWTTDWEEVYVKGDNPLIEPYKVVKNSIGENEQLYKIKGYLELPFSKQYGVVYDEKAEATADFDAQRSSDAIDAYIINQAGKVQNQELQKEIETKLDSPESQQGLKINDSDVYINDPVIKKRLKSFYEEIKETGDLEKTLGFRKMLEEAKTEQDIKKVLDLKRNSIVNNTRTLITNNEGTSDEMAIQKGFESGYDVVLGYGKFGRPTKDGKEVSLTTLTVAEVFEFQNRLINNSKGKLSGVPKSMGSSAVGAYQFIKPTLEAFLNKGLISENTIFTAEVQEKLYLKLLEKAGLNEYESGSMSYGDYMDNLSKIWASVPNSKGKSSYGQPVGSLSSI